MPTINCNIKDMERLYGHSMEIDKWSELLEKAKSELKDYDKDTGDMRIEIVDTNRPDLWSAEGLARQLRNIVLNKRGDYLFFNSSPGEREKIIVNKNLKNIRPYIGGFIVSNLTVDEFLLKQLIETQEKLCVNYGRSRDLIAIGVYDASKIEFPIKYSAVKPDEMKFVPLGFTEEMDLNEILEKHPKGQEYGHIVKNFSHYPIITDNKDHILSFPPVINSDDLGKVVEGNTFLFVEVTGTELEAVVLAVNILACNLSDRGGKIKPFMVEYDYENLKEGVITPKDLRQIVTLDHKYLEHMVGESIDRKKVEDCLLSMGFNVKSEDNSFICQTPPYRRDCLHQVDLVEDYCIARGYNTLPAQMPDKYTVGATLPVVEFADTIRNLMVGMGFQEFMTYILTGKDKVFDKLNRQETRIIEVDNVMTETFSILRPSLLPSLMEIEGKNMRVEFPHKIFEEGEVVIYSPEENLGTKTLHNICAIISHSGTNFSEIHSSLHSIMFYLNIPYKLEEMSDPAFIEGRAGKIICHEKEVGLIGEINPQVLENFGITVPVGAFEFTLDYLI